MSLTLVSSNGYEFTVDLQAIKHSGVIAPYIEDLKNNEAVPPNGNGFVAMLTRWIAPLIQALLPVAPPVRIPVPKVTGRILLQVIEWCNQHKDEEPLPMEDEQEDYCYREIVIPQWDRDFLSNFDKTTLLELTMAAYNLKITALLDFTCKAIALTFNGKTNEQIRDYWGVPDEFPPEEQAAFNKENEWCG